MAGYFLPFNNFIIVPIIQFIYFNVTLPIAYWLIFCHNRISNLLCSIKANRMQII